ATLFQKRSFPALQRFQALRPMISSGDKATPPSIGLKTSAVICGKSAVVLPASLASSSATIGSFFHQQPATKKSATMRANALMRLVLFRIWCLRVSLVFRMPKSFMDGIGRRKVVGQFVEIRRHH